jgi:acetyl-CoA carboxylase carboxyltransferase component
LQVKAATGEVVDDETLGGGLMHASESGVVDHLAVDDAHGIALIRDLVGDLGKAGWEPAPSSPTDVAARAPLYPASELGGIVGADVRRPFEIRDVIARLVDGSELREFKKEYGTTLVTVRDPSYHHSYVNERLTCSFCSCFRDSHTFTASPSGLSPITVCCSARAH